MIGPGQINSHQDAIRYHLEPHGFIGRGWLLDEVRSFYDANDRRQLVIVGEPGWGKSSLIAHLAATFNCPRHFIRTASTSGTLGLSPRAFLISLGSQLYQKYGRAIFDRAEVGSTRVLTQLARDDAKVIGRAIDTFYTLPFLPIAERQVNVEARVTTGRARVIGETISRVYDITEGLDELTLLHAVLINPLLRLLELQPSERVLVLIDALDESVVHPGRNITDVIPRPDDCSFPANLRLLATSRRGKHLVGFGRSVLDLDSAESYRQRSEEDVHAYISKRLENPVLEAALAEAAEPCFRERIAAKSDTNFLYLYHYFNELERLVARGDPIRDVSVGPGLDEIYRVFALEKIRRNVHDVIRIAFNAVIGPGLLESWKAVSGVQALEATGAQLVLTAPNADVVLPPILHAAETAHLRMLDLHTEKGAGLGNWERKYLPLLGTLAVAREPLTRTELADFAEVELPFVDTILMHILQFLEVTSDARQERYRLYHGSFSDYLLDAKRNRDYPLDASQYHHRLVKRHGIGNAPEDSAEHSDYFWRHLFHHAYMAGVEGSNFGELFRLADSGYLSKKLVAVAKHDWVSSDYDLLFQACSLSQNVGQLAQYALGRSALTQVSARASIGGLTRLRLNSSSAGHAQRLFFEMRNSTDLLEDPLEKASALITLYDECGETLRGIPELESLPDEASRAVLPVPHGRERDAVIQTLVKAVIAQQPSRAIWAEELVDHIHMRDNLCEIWVAMAEAYSRADHEDDAVRCWKEAIRQFPFSSIVTASNFLRRCAGLSVPQSIERLMESIGPVLDQINADPPAFELQSWANIGIMADGGRPIGKDAALCVIMAGLLARLGRTDAAVGVAGLVLDRLGVAPDGDGLVADVSELAHMAVLIEDPKGLAQVWSRLVERRRQLPAKMASRLTAHLVTALAGRVSSRLLAPGEALLETCTYVPTELGDHGSLDALEELIEACRAAQAVDAIRTSTCLLEHIRSAKHHARFASRVSSALHAVSDQALGQKAFEHAVRVFQGAPARQRTGGGIALARSPFAASKALAPALIGADCRSLQVLATDAERMQGIVDILGAIDASLEEATVNDIVGRCVAACKRIPSPHSALSVVARTAATYLSKPSQARLVLELDRTSDQPTASTTFVGVASITATVLHRTGHAREAAHALRQASHLIRRVRDEHLKWTVTPDFTRACIALRAESALAELLEDACQLTQGWYTGQVYRVVLDTLPGGEFIHILDSALAKLSTVVERTTMRNRGGVLLQLARGLQRIAERPAALGLCIRVEGELERLPLSWNQRLELCGALVVARARLGHAAESARHLESAFALWRKGLDTPNDWWSSHIDSFALALLDPGDLAARENLIQRALATTDLAPGAVFGLVTSLADATTTASSESCRLVSTCCVRGLTDRGFNRIDRLDSPDDHLSLCQARACAALAAALLRADSLESASDWFQRGIDVTTHIASDQLNAWAHRALLEQCPANCTMRQPVEDSARAALARCGERRERGEIALAWLGTVNKPPTRSIVELFRNLWDPMHFREALSAMFARTAAPWGTAQAILRASDLLPADAALYACATAALSYVEQTSQVDDGLIGLLQQRIEAAVAAGFPS